MRPGGRAAGQAGARRAGAGAGARGSYPVPQSTTQGGREPAMLGPRGRPGRLPRSPARSPPRAAAGLPGASAAPPPGARMLSAGPRDAPPTHRRLTNHGADTPCPRPLPPAIFSAGNGASLSVRPTLLRERL